MRNIWLSRLASNGLRRLTKKLAPVAFFVACLCLEMFPPFGLPRAFAETYPYIDCHDRQLVAADICHSKAIAELSEKVFCQLKVLKDSKFSKIRQVYISFDQTLRTNIQNCDNLPTSSQTPATMQSCVTDALSLAKTTASASATYAELLDYVVHGQIVHLEQVRQYPDAFVGINGLFFGHLYITSRQGEHELTGYIADYLGRGKFEAILEHPTQNNINLFVNGRCRSGCVSSWRGTFVRKASKIVFQLSPM